MSCQYRLFSQRFGVGIMAQPMGSVRSALVDTTLILSLKRDARTAAEHQPANALRLTSGNHMPRPLGIDRVVGLPGPPDTGYRGSMKYNINIATGSLHSLGIPDVAFH